MKAPTTPEAAYARDVRLARQWEPSIRRLFRRESRRVIASNGRTGVKPAEWERLINEMWADIGRQTFDAEYVKLTGQEPPDKNHPYKRADDPTLVAAFVAGLVKYWREAATGITRATRRSIRAALAALPEAERLLGVQKALAALYQRRFIRRRAYRIALDQAMRATASVEYMAALFATEVTGTVFEQRWLNQGDSRVRDSHTGVEPVLVGEPFQLAGGTVRYPRDPAGPASETYGCRCWTERQQVR